MIDRQNLFKSSCRRIILPLLFFAKALFAISYFYLDDEA